MSGPRFAILVRIDDQHLISACAHGVVHLTWERATLRFALDEFRELVGLAEQAAAARAPWRGGSGRLAMDCRPDGPCELQAGAVILRLPPAEFRRLAGALLQARRRLDELLASGEWSDDEPPGPGRRDPFEGLRDHLFSVN